MKLRLVTYGLSARGTTTRGRPQMPLSRNPYTTFANSIPAEEVRVGDILVIEDDEYPVIHVERDCWPWGTGDTVTIFYLGEQYGKLVFHHRDIVIKWGW